MLRVTGSRGAEVSSPWLLYTSVSEIGIGENISKS